METALLDMPIVWPKHAIAVNANLVRPIKPLISIPPLLLICQQTPLSNTGRKNGFTNVCERCKYVVNLELQICITFALSAKVWANTYIC